LVCDARTVVTSPLIKKQPAGPGFKFKNFTQSSQSPQEKILLHFAGSVRGQSEKSPAIERVGLLDEQEPSSFIDPETVNFNLYLPATSEETIEEAQISSKSTEYESIQFQLDEDIELEEVEGLGLEPLYTSKTLITEKLEAYTTEAVSISLDTAIDSIEELTIDNSVAIDETASLEPILKIGDPEEEPTLSLEPFLEIGEPESEEVALNLGEKKLH
jgi:hypothetical protein